MVPSCMLLQQFKSQVYIKKWPRPGKFITGCTLLETIITMPKLTNTKSTQTTFLVLPFVIFTSLFTTQKKKNKIFTPGYNDNLSTSWAEGCGWLQDHLQPGTGINTLELERRGAAGLSWCRFIGWSVYWMTGLSVNVHLWHMSQCLIAV